MLFLLLIEIPEPGTEPVMQPPCDLIGLQQPHTVGRELTAASSSLVEGLQLSARSGRLYSNTIISCPRTSGTSTSTRPSIQVKGSVSRSGAQYTAFGGRGRRRDSGI